MNLDNFKTQISQKGLAKNFNWVCSIYPPKDLSFMTRSYNLGGLGQARVNLPGLDLSNIPIAEINNLNNNLPNVGVTADLNLPTFGFTAVNSNASLERLNLYCNMASIPEREIKNTEWREYGESRQLGIVHQHSKGISLSYYCSEDLFERYFFEQWQELIFNSTNKRRSYYKDYISRVEISKWDTGWQNESAVYRLHEAYPSNISAQSLNYEGASVMRLDINMKYRYYERIK